MRRSYVLIIAILIIGALASGCISTTGVQSSRNGSTSSISHHSSSKQAGIETFPAAAAMKTAEINGTFSGNLTAPKEIFGKVEKFLEKMNATLYSFEARIIGNKSNSSITVYVLRLVPPFIPKEFEVTINAHPINGTTFVPYAWTIPVSVEFGNVTTTSYLKASPKNIVKGTGNLMESELDNLNGSTILTINELRFVVLVSKPGSYIFAVFHNDTEISSGDIEVGR